MLSGTSVDASTFPLVRAWQSAVAAAGEAARRSWETGNVGAERARRGQAARRTILKPKLVLENDEDDE